MVTYTTVDDTAWGPIRDEEVIIVDTDSNFNAPGSELKIDDNYTFKIFEVQRDGTTITEGSGTLAADEWEFKRPNTIKLGTSSTDQEVYEADRLIHMKTSQVEYYIDSAEALINSRLKNLYTVPFSSPIPDTIKTLTEYLARSFIIEGLATLDDYQVSDTQLEMAQRMRNMVMQKLDMLAAGDDELEGLDADESQTIATPVIYLDDSENETTV